MFLHYCQRFLQKTLNPLKSLAFTWLCLLLSSTLCAYEVRMEGELNEEALKLIRSVSQLEILKGTAPATLIGLKRRAEEDIPNIVKALHSLGYYEAEARFEIQDKGAVVLVFVEKGPLYTLSEFKIEYVQNGHPLECPHQKITLKDIGIKLGDVALPKTILDAEDSLLDRLNLMGYAFATIEKREVLADQKADHVIVLIKVNTGPLAYFGPITISGRERVLEDFFYKKIQWQEGDLYDPRKVQKMQEALEFAGLFRSVNITHAEKTKEDNTLPIHISVVEAKQHSIGLGVNYTTELGPGITAEWEDRNIAGMGQKLSFRLDLWKIRQEGTLTYLIPDFLRPNQNLIWQLDYHHDQIKSFTDSTFSFSGVIERKLSEHLRVSYGGMYKHIHSENSSNNGTFDLIQAPLQLRWSNANSLLDPNEGGSVTLKSIPSLQFLSPQFAYCVNLFTGTYYQALTKDKRHVLATKLMLGSIVGASKHDIPPPERFYAGSESMLRGYKYMTVSPLGCHNKPLGGRSLFIYSLELRNRVGENFGWTAFYEIGNVYANPYPDFKGGMLQSAGVGLSYYTPVGPLRADIAFPLNPRRHLDGPFQIYFSIGQSF
jgi:translocation and assembly module TamA